MVQDETIVILGWNVHCSWYLKGEEVTTPVSLSRKRFHACGVLGEDGELFYMSYDKMDGESFIDFLGHVHRRYGKVVLFTDNASWHKSKAVREALERFDGDIVLEYFMPYTPDLNSIEKQWHMIKRAIANTLYESIEDLEAGIRKMLDSGEIQVAKMQDYLCFNKRDEPEAEARARPIPA